jgi:hypothetical protein
MNYELIKMRNKQRRYNQTNQDCIGANLRVCPAIANSIDISKQTEFSFANAGTNCKLAPKESLHQQIGFVIHNS